MMMIEDGTISGETEDDLTAGAGALGGMTREQGTLRDMSTDMREAAGVMATTESRVPIWTEGVCL